MSRTEIKGERELESLSDQEEFIVFDLLVFLRDRMMYIILLTLLSIACAIGYGLLRYPPNYITDIIISLNFPGIEKYKNPDDSQFEERQIITPKILSNVIEIMENEQNNSVIYRNLRNLIEIQPVIPEEIKARMLQAKNQNTVFEYYPNHFRLILKTTKNMVIPSQDRERIMYLIFDEYRKDFNKKYGEEALIVTDFPDNFNSTYDYIDIIDVYNIKIRSLLAFLEEKIKTSGFFRSRQTGRSFIDLKDEIEVFQNIEISKIESKIRILKLTRNTENLINQYKDKVEQLDLARQKKEAEAIVAKRLLADLRQPVNIPQDQKRGSGKDTTNIVIDNSIVDRILKNDYYQVLIETALKADTSSNEMRLDKEFWEKQVNGLEKKRKNNEIDENINKNLNDEFLRIQEKLISCLEETNTLNKEYLHNLLEGAVSLVKEPETTKFRDYNIRKRALLAGVAGFFMSILLVFLADHFQKANQRRSNRGK